MDVRLSWKTKATKRENLGGVRNASLLGMIKYRDNSCRAVPAGWYFKIVASSGSTALGFARESEGRWKKPRHETRGRYRRHRRDRARETRGRTTRDRRGRERNGRRRSGVDGKKETRRGRHGGTDLLLGKPNLRGAQNAEAILRTYHRSRLRPPSPSPSHPPSGLSTPSTEEGRDGWKDREGPSSHLSLYTLPHLSVFSLPSHFSRSSRTRFSPPSSSPFVSQTWKRSVDAPRNDAAF